MLDIVHLVATGAFFVAAIAYAVGCDRL